MEQASEFLSMGGYAGYVWPAFAVTAVVMIWLLSASLRRLRANERLLEQMQGTGSARRSGRNRSAASGDKAP